MKRIVALAALLCAAPASPQEPPRWSSAAPPLRFQGTGFVPVIYVPFEMMDAACRPPDAPANVTVFACTRSVTVNGRALRVVVLPDPCPLASVERFALLACHENAHLLRNWKHETQ